MLINEGIRLRQRYTALFSVVVVGVVTIIIIVSRAHMRDCSIVTLCVLLSLVLTLFLDARQGESKDLGYSRSLSSEDATGR